MARPRVQPLAIDAIDSKSSAPSTGTDEEWLRVFRTVRDAIKPRLRIFLTIANKN